MIDKGIEDDVAHRCAHLFREHDRGTQEAIGITLFRQLDPRAHWINTQRPYPVDLDAYAVDIKLD